MTSRIPHILEVIVLATGAHAALRTRCRLVRAFIIPKEDILELHHAGVRKQKCWIVSRHKWRTRHYLVAVVMEKIQERLAELVARHGFHGAYGNC